VTPAPVVSVVVSTVGPYCSVWPGLRRKTKKRPPFPGGRYDMTADTAYRRRHH
jgi:hypothetical protein